MESAKVSIVIPVYNVPENALRKCINSAVAQTLKEVEIILVDDGSTDSSGAVCESYKQEDSRIKVIHKHNGGLASARNRGYRAASGEWITFVDGDDWIEPETCEVAYIIGEKENVDVVLFGMIQDLKTHSRNYTYHFEDGKKFIGDECRKLQTEVLDFTGNIATVPAKLFRKEVLDLNNIEHKEFLRQGSEGTEFNIRFFEIIHSAYFTEKKMYHYVYNNASISAKHSEEKQYQIIRCFEEIEKDIVISENKDLMTMFYNRFSYVVIAAAITGYFSPQNRELYKLKKEHFRNYLSQRLVDETIKKVDPSKLDYQRRIILMLIKMNWFRPLQLLGYIRFKQKNG